MKGKQKVQPSERNYLLVFAGVLICWAAWFLLAVIPTMLLPVIILLLFSAVAAWRNDIFPRKSSVFFLMASLIGMVAEASREGNVPLGPRYEVIGDRPLVDDGDGLWTLMIPFTIFLWVTVKIMSSHFQVIQLSPRTSLIYKAGKIALIIFVLWTFLFLLGFLSTHMTVPELN